MSAETERFIDDATAIKSGNNFVAVLQANSPKAMGENRIGNAGDIWVPGPDGIKVYAGHTGVLAQILHGWTNYVIWPSNRAEGKSGPIETSWGKPPEAKWVPDPQRPNRNAFLMPGGARVRATTFDHALIDGYPVIFPFAAPQHDEGADLYNAALAIAFDVDGSGDLIKCIGAKFRITTGVSHGVEGQPYYSFKWKLAGVLGEKDGPTPEEARAAKPLRAALVHEQRRQDAAWKIEEASRRTALINARPHVIEHQPFGGGGVPMSERPRPVITSGPQTRRDQGPPPPAPPAPSHTQYDGPNDDLPDFGAPPRR